MCYIACTHMQVPLEIELKSEQIMEDESCISLAIMDKVDAL